MRCSGGGDLAAPLNAPSFFKGALQTLQPKIDDGRLSLRSALLRIGITARHIVKSSDTSLEIMAGGVHKGAALRRLCATDDSRWRTR